MDIRVVQLQSDLSVQAFVFATRPFSSFLVMASSSKPEVVVGTEGAEQVEQVGQAEEAPHATDSESEGASDASSTSEAEDTDINDDEHDKKSRDGEEGGGDGDGHQPPPSSSGAMASSDDPSTFSPFVTIDESEQVITPEFIEQIEALSLEDLEEAEGIIKKEGQFIVKKLEAVQKKVRVMKKEAKKAERQAAKKAREAEEKEMKRIAEEEGFTLNINKDGTNIPIRVKSFWTVKDLRDEIARVLFPSATKKEIGKMTIYKGDEDISTSGRKTMSGLKLRDGDVLRTSFGIKGGAKKRAADGSKKSMNKDDRIEEKMAEARLFLQTVEKPDVKKSTDYLTQMSVSITNESFKDSIKRLSIDNLKKFQAGIQSSNDETSRLEVATKVVADECMADIQKKEKFVKMMSGVVKALVSVVVFKAVMEDNGRISWETLRQMIESEIVSKAEERGRQHQGTGS